MPQGINGSGPQQFPAETTIGENFLGGVRGAQDFVGDSPVTLDISHIGKFLTFGGLTASGKIITLPKHSEVPSGSVLLITNNNQNTSFGLNLQAPAGTTISWGIINNAASSVTLDAGASVVLYLSGTIWFATGLGIMKNSYEFANSKNANGYQKLPSALIIQWGTFTTASPYIVTLPITFPNGILQALGQATASPAVAYLTGTTNSSLTFSMVNSTTNVAITTSMACRFIAIGW